MTKVAFIYSDLGVGGVQRKIIDLLNHAFAQRKNIEIDLLLDNLPKFNFLNQINNSSVSVVVKDQWLKNHFFKNGEKIHYFFFIFYHLLVNNYDSVLVFLPRSSIFAVFVSKILFWKKIRIILSEDVITKDAYQRGEFCWFLHFVLPILYKQADLVITSSHYAKDQLKQNYGLSKNVKVIYNWTKLKPQVRCLDKTTDLLFLSRLDENKGIRYIKKLLKDKKIENTVVSIVGAGNLEKKMREDLWKLSSAKIKFHGPIISVSSFFAKSKIYVLLSHSEVLPITFLEAFSQQCIVVSLWYPGIEEVIEHGETGFVCSSVNEIVVTVQDLLKNYPKYKTIKMNALQQLTTKFTTNNMEQYWKVILDE